MQDLSSKFFTSLSPQHADYSGRGLVVLWAGS